VIGPSSTGKTTLCDALAKALNLSPSQYVKEVARTVMREQKFTRRDMGKVMMQKAILDAQLSQEEKCRQYASSVVSPGKRVVLSDRSAIDAIVYTELTAPTASEARERVSQLVQTPAFQRVLPIYRQALFVLLIPVKEWVVDDGVRGLDDAQKCPEAFRRRMGELGLQFCEVGGEMRGLDERVGFVRRFARL
jgi:nicotinamide riboside kinase